LISLCKYTTFAQHIVQQTTESYFALHIFKISKRGNMFRKWLINKGFLERFLISFKNNQKSALGKCSSPVTSTIVNNKF